jgi:hypothetical protein
MVTYQTNQRIEGIYENIIVGGRSPRRRAENIPYEIANNVELATLNTWRERSLVSYLKCSTHVPRKSACAH